MQAPAVLGWTLVGTVLGLQVNVFLLCLLLLSVVTAGVQLHWQSNAELWLLETMAIDATARPHVLAYSSGLPLSSTPA